MQNVFKIQNMRKLFFAFCFIYSLNAFSQEEHLMPIKNIYLHTPHSYEEIRRDSFFKGITYNTLARYVSFPSFENYKTFSIDKIENEYGLLTSHVVDMTKKGIPIFEYKYIEIDSVFATKMNQLFILIISQTSFSPNITAGLDGTSYFFVASDPNTSRMVGGGYGIISGQIWSPRTERFISLNSLCDTLSKLETEKEYEVVKKELERKCDSLIKLF
jgi:hypothetical protein